MAIQHRRGVYSRFDPSRMVAGEWAVVLSGDPVAKDGKAAYVCFAAGDVKRVATYEDMMDFLMGLQESVIAYTVEEATGAVRAELLAMMDGAGKAEAARKIAEGLRRQAETARSDAEDTRAAAEAARRTAEAARAASMSDFEGKVAEGFFHGATFTPSVSEDGVLSWLNDKGLPNPESVSVRGPKGNDGVVTQLAAGMYGLKVVDGRLKLICGADSTPPDLYLEGGHLFLKIGE